MENILPYQKVLVTGAAGWLGRRLVVRLANGLADDERFATSKPGLAIRALDLPSTAASTVAPVAAMWRSDGRHPQSS